MNINNVFLGTSTCFSFEESTLIQTLRRMPLLDYLRETKSVILRNLYIFAENFLTAASVALPTKNLSVILSALHQVSKEILPENGVQDTSERQ